MSASDADALGFVGFFRALFDFSFRTFISRSVVKVLYVLAVAAAALVGLGALLPNSSHSGDGSASGEGRNPFALLEHRFVLVPFGFLLFCIFVRLCLEQMAAFFLIERHTATLVSLIEGQLPPDPMDPQPAPEPAAPSPAPTGPSTWSRPRALRTPAPLLNLGGAEVATVAVMGLSFVGIIVILLRG